MKEDHEIISDEELKRFFLNEALLLCPSTRADLTESEKLWMLHVRLKKMNKLTGMLCNQDLGEYMLEMQEVLGFYLVEKNESKKKKFRMNEHLNSFNQFAIRLTRFSDTLGHCYLFYNRHLRTLERVIKLYFPGEFKKKQEEEVARQGGNTGEKETGNE